MLDFTQKSTMRGVVWIIASLISTYFLFNNDIERSTVTLSLAATISGALGLLND